MTNAPSNSALSFHFSVDSAIWWVSVAPTAPVVATARSVVRSPVRSFFPRAQSSFCLCLVTRSVTPSVGSIVVFVPCSAVLLSLLGQSFGQSFGRLCPSLVLLVSSLFLFRGVDQFPVFFNYWCSPVESKSID